MTYLLDTNTSSDLMNSAQASLTGWARAVSSGDDVCLSVVNVGEHLFGIERLGPGKRQDYYRQRLDEITARLTVLDLPRDAVPIYGRIKAVTQARGRTIGDNDLWIASTALSLGATLVTRDRDFDAVDGLRRADWSA